MTMIPWLYKWLPIFFGCHCMDSRSFHYRNKKFPICARCTGELVGILAAAILFAFVHPGVLWSALLLIPLVIDGGVQALTRYETLGREGELAREERERALCLDIARSGALVSEYPPGTEPAGWHFPVRNRILSGLCLATLVVEAPERSGALITAETALEQGRDVFAVPGPITSKASQGANRLLRDGAGVAGESWDVLREYAGRFPHKLRCVHVEPPKMAGYEAREAAQAAVVEPPPDQKESLPLLRLYDSGLTDDQIAILRYLREVGTAQVDDVIEGTQIPARRALSALTLLELEEQVRQESGKRFTLAVTLIE